MAVAKASARAHNEMEPIPLAFAAYNSNLSVVKLLTKANASLDIDDVLGIPNSGQYFNSSILSYLDKKKHTWTQIQHQR